MSSYYCQKCKHRLLALDADCIVCQQAEQITDYEIEVEHLREDYKIAVNNMTKAQQGVIEQAEQIAELHVVVEVQAEQIEKFELFEMCDCCEIKRLQKKIEIIGDHENRKIRRLKEALQKIADYGGLCGNDVKRIAEEVLKGMNDE